MPSPEHDIYIERLVQSISILAEDPDRLNEIRQYAEAIMLLAMVDLGPALPILDRCYAEHRRGSERYCPLAMFRLLLLGACIGEMRINKLVFRVRHSRVLAIIAGFCWYEKENDNTPCVSVVYDLLHRLHDGPIRRIRGAARPSVIEYQRTKAELRPDVRHGKENACDEAQTTNPETSDSTSTDERDAKSGEKTAKGGKKSRSKTTGKRTQSYRDRAKKARQVTEALRLQLVEQDRNALPDDLPTRLLEILDAVALRPSAEAGLLGDIHALVVAADGSPLETNADGHGTKVETCPHGRWERCDCPRFWSDPDSARGWDHYRGKYFFGYNFMELNIVGGTKALPMFIGLDPANTSEQVSFMRAFSIATRYLHRSPGERRVDTAIGDAGFDGEPLQRYMYENLGIKTVIPLADGGPPVHPVRKEIRLDKNTAVPLCEAGCAMAAWGTAGEGHTSFICPVKAGKIPTCPLAPQDRPDWVCRPEQKYGPTVTMNAADNPRLFPVIARNSKKYKDLYNKRTACERSNAFKKGSGNIEDSGHRRWSFWLIRLYTLAILQHAKAWTAGTDAVRFLANLLGDGEVQPG